MVAKLFYLDFVQSIISRCIDTLKIPIVKLINR